MMRTTGACRPVAVAGAVTLLALLAAGEAAAQETVTIGGRSLGITQRASTPPPCPSSPDDLNPSEIDIGWVGWPRTIWVAGPSDCSWSVTEDEDWITVSPSPVFGGGTLTIEVTSNTSGAPRTGLVTVVGRSVIVRQGAQCPDEPDELDPSSVAVGSAGGTSRMWASGRSDCEWGGERGSGLDHGESIQGVGRRRSVRDLGGGEQRRRAGREGEGRGRLPPRRAGGCTVSERTGRESGGGDVRRRRHRRGRRGGQRLGPLRV